MSTVDVTYRDGTTESIDGFPSTDGYGRDPLVEFWSGDEKVAMVPYQQIAHIAFSPAMPGAGDTVDVRVKSPNHTLVRTGYVDHRQTNDRWLVLFDRIGGKDRAIAWIPMANVRSVRQSPAKS